MLPIQNPRMMVGARVDDPEAALHYGPREVVLTLQGRPPQEANQRAISMFYTNHRGEKHKRHVIPFDFVYGVMHPWYLKPQWLMIAWDLGKEAWRTFAMDDVSGWNPNFHEGPPHADGAGKGG